MNVAIIPARGGSKRIPRKNIKPFCGKPMIAWSIEAAVKSQCFDMIIVSTDDAEIASLANDYGALVPFLRPKDLSDDSTGTLPVMAHAVRWVEEHYEKPVNICCLYATAPFVCPDDLQKGLKVLEESGADYAFSVTSYSFPIQRAIRITQDKRIEMFNSSEFMTRSQDLEESWHDAGQFYWGKADAWLEERMVFSPISAPVFLPRFKVQDIDTVEDWLQAELMFKAIEMKNSS